MLERIKLKLKNEESNFIDYDSKSSLVVYSNVNNEFVVSEAVDIDTTICLQNGNYFDSLFDAAKTFESRKNDLAWVTDLNKGAILNEEIAKIKNNISNIETSLEKIERIIESFSPNLFGTNGYLDELALLEKKRDELKLVGDEKELLAVEDSINTFVSNIQNTIGIDITEIRDSQNIINKAKEVHSQTVEQLNKYKQSLETIAGEYEKISNKVGSLFESKEAANELRELMTENKETSQNLEQR
jgi:chromosome segregation ATPase